MTSAIRQIPLIAFIVSVVLMWNVELAHALDEPPSLEFTPPSADSAMSHVPGIAEFAGVNWADRRDNFVDGWVIPSGLHSTDNEAVIRAKAERILSGLQTNLGADTVRLPINPSTVLESWWQRYQIVIDTALGKDMKVILACWEAESSKDGRVDNLPKFWEMWEKVLEDYGETPGVYFEVFNEPHGYSLAGLKGLYLEWLTRFDAEIPRSRVLLGGTGYSGNVVPIGADHRFDGCLLSLHIYAWWGHYTHPAQWQAVLRQKFQGYESRTVLTEFGVPMTTGTDYDGRLEGSAEIAFLQGITAELRRHHMSSVYWPGLRSGDSYSLQRLEGSGTNLSLHTTNPSGRYRLRFGWGIGASLFDPNTYYTLTRRNSTQVLDVRQSSTRGGAEVIQWPSNGGANQQWRIVDVGHGYYKLINRTSGMALDVRGASTTRGAYVIQWQDNGGFNQQWAMSPTRDGCFKIISRNTNQVLDVKGESDKPGTRLIQWPWNGGDHQQWRVSRP